MKALRNILLVLCVLTLVALVVMLCMGLSGTHSFWEGNNMAFNFFNFGGGSSANWLSEFNGDVAPEGHVSFDPAKVNGIEVQWIAGKVEIVYKDVNTDTVELVQMGKHDRIAEDRLLAYRLDENGVIHVREGKGRRVSSGDSTNLTIYLPEGFTFGGDVSLGGISSDVNVSQLTAANVKMNTTSGDIALGKCFAVRADVTSTSGDISISGMKLDGKLDASSTNGEICVRDSSAVDMEVSTTNGEVIVETSEITGKLEMGTTNGELTCSAVSAVTVEATTVSGEVAVSGAFDSIRAHSVNGEIMVSTTHAPSFVDINTVNGEVLLKLPTDIPGFTVSYSKVNGSFNCDFPTVQNKNEAVYGDGSSKINVSTVNGEIDIETIERPNNFS